MCIYIFLYIYEYGAHSYFIFNGKKLKRNNGDASAVCFAIFFFIYFVEIRFGVRSSTHTHARARALMTRPARPLQRLSMSYPFHPFFFASFAPTRNPPKTRAIALKAHKHRTNIVHKFSSSFAP